MGVQWQRPRGLYFMATLLQTCSLAGVTICYCLLLSTQISFLFADCESLNSLDVSEQFRLSDLCECFVYNLTHCLLYFLVLS